MGLILNLLVRYVYSKTYTLNINDFSIMAIQNGLQPIHIAAMCGHLDILKYLAVLPDVSVGASPSLGVS